MSEEVDMPRKFVPPPMELVKERIAEVLPPDAKQQVEAGEVALIDTRQPERYELGHIPGAVNVPAGENGADAAAAEFAARVAEAADGKPALLYCNSGSRSARATDALTNDHSVEGARSLVGGIKLWNDLGYEVDGTVTDEDDDATAEEGEG
jgi:hydroxyacylglutathione hydrolase